MTLVYCNVSGKHCAVVTDRGGMKRCACCGQRVRVVSDDRATVPGVIHNGQTDVPHLRMARPTP